MANNFEKFSEAYKIKVRAAWYDNGCPSADKMDSLGLIPADENGDAVSLYMLKRWLTDGSWFQWKDAQDAALSVKVESELMERKVALIKEQLDQTKVVRDKAYEAIKDGRFDTSASAVTAFFRASEAERGLMQIEKVIEDLARLQTAELQTQFRELAERAGSGVIDGEEKIEENGEEDDTK